MPPRPVAHRPLTRLAATLPGVWNLVLAGLGRGDLAMLLRVGRALAYDTGLRGSMLNGTTYARWFDLVHTSMARWHWQQWAAASPPLSFKAPRFSVGGAAIPLDADAAEGLLAVADQRLYVSKREGGDRLTLTPPVLISTA